MNSSKMRIKYSKYLSKIVPKITKYYKNNIQIKYQILSTKNYTLIQLFITENTSRFERKSSITSKASDLRTDFQLLDAN